MTVTRAVVLAAVAALANLAPAARAGIDVEVPPVLTARSTLAAGEVEHYRFHAVEGALLTLNVAAAKRAANLDFDPSCSTPPSPGEDGDTLRLSLARGRT